MDFFDKLGVADGFRKVAASMKRSSAFPRSPQWRRSVHLLELNVS
jgi:hypothetical protein